MSVLSRQWPPATLARISSSLLGAQRRALSRTTPQCNHGTKQGAQLDVEELLSKPTWSVSSLLPPKDSSQTQEVSSKQLHHLLRLSALPPPKDAGEEEKMLSTLSSQLDFVKEIQKVDTTGVQPLRSLRDETAVGEKEAEIGMEAMKDAFAQEHMIGRRHSRIRRRNDPQAEKMEEWDVLGTASKKARRYFVVEGGKDG